MLVMTLVKVSFRALYDVFGGFRSRYRAREDLYNKQLAFSSGRHPESRCAESKKSSLQPQIPVWLHVEDYNGDLINTLPSLRNTIGIVPNASGSATASNEDRESRIRYTQHIIHHPRCLSVHPERSFSTDSPGMPILNR